MKMKCVSLAASLAMLAASSLQASVVTVSAGYNDGTGGGGSPLPPNPWYGSPNTTFYGDAGMAQSGDPDENAILLQNLGGTAVTLSAANMGTWNLFSLDGIVGSVIIGAGQNVILAGVDGSDVSSGSTVSVTIDSINYSFQDVTTQEAPSGVLFGNSPWVNGVETVPWTTLGSTAAVPEPSSFLAGGMLLLPMGASLLRKLRKV